MGFLFREEMGLVGVGRTTDWSNWRTLFLDGLVGASWVNILLLPFWEFILRPELASATGLRPTAEASWAAVVVTVLFGVLGAAAGWVLRRPISTPVRTAVNLLVFPAWLLVLDAVRVLSGIYAASVWAWLVNLGLPLAILLGIGVASLARWHRLLALATVRIFMLVSPFLVMTVGRAVFVASTTDFAALDPSPAKQHTSSSMNGRRVILVMYDGLDYGLAFSRRPPGLRLDAFDRLRHESFFATNVRPHPAPTVLAVPSLLSGESVDSLVRQTSTSLFVRLTNDSVTRDLAQATTLFDDAASSGARSELVGSFLPYCRWRIASFTSRCTAIPMSRGGIFDHHLTLPQAVVRQLVALAGPITVRQGRIRGIQELIDASVRASSDPSVQLAFLHLFVPHSPYIWNSDDSTFSRTRFRRSGYFGNLVLADRILARLRKTVVDAGLASRTVFIITSDHGYTDDGAVGGVIPDRRVPLAVLFPSQTSVEWVKPIAPLPLRALVRELLENTEVQTASDLARWFAQRDAPRE